MSYELHENKIYFITYSLAEESDLIFSDTEKVIIKNLMLEKANEFNIKIPAYAILHNHFHLLFHVNESFDNSKFLKQIAGISSRRINQINNRSGTLWERYYSWMVTTEEAYWNILSYIAGNPIRHGLVYSFDELYSYPYSNFNELADNKGREAVEMLVLKVLKIKSELDEERFFRSLSMK
jgi:putative transposase